MKRSLFENRDISVTLRRGTRRCLFDNFFYDIDENAFCGISAKNEEFNKFLGFGNQIWITDKNRSWGNNIDFRHLQVLLRPYLNAQTVAIGNSMGEFLVIATIVAN